MPKNFSSEAQILRR